MVQTIIHNNRIIEIEDDAKSYLIGTTTYDIHKSPSEEETNALLEITNRDRRNQLLQETDWTANSDVTMSAKMKTYRKSLRDLPTHKNWPNLKSTDWPTKPS